MIQLVSYSIKKGKPDFLPMKHRLFNVTSRITNPWRVKSLRKLNGLDLEVQQFINNCKRTKAMLQEIFYLLPLGYSIGVCCHGGKHRSVAIVEMLAEYARSNSIEVEVIHRDLDIKGEGHGKSNNAVV